jgi:hypothetical protein
MKMTIVGAARSAGDYDIDGKRGTYDNIVLHCVHADRKIEGQAVEVLKLKTAEYSSDIVVASGASLGAEPHGLKPLIGKVIDVDRDERGRVCDVELVK